MFRALGMTHRRRRPGRLPCHHRRRFSDPIPKITPLSAEHYALQATLSKVARQALQRVLDLLGHELSPGDIDGALERALVMAADQLEKRKCAATERPRRSLEPCEGSRHIPASVKRVVWERDGGRCTFGSDDGLRCPSRLPEESHAERAPARHAVLAAEPAAIVVGIARAAQVERTDRVTEPPYHPEQGERAHATGIGCSA